MTAALSAEQLDLRQTVADLMAKRSPESEVRRLMATDAGYDPVVWSELAALGLLGLAIPEKFGGAGAQAAELGVVAEQTGRALLCAPFLSTAVLTPYLLLALGDDDENAVVLPRIAAGDLIAREAGCFVGDHTGSAFRYNAPRPSQASLICATPGLAPLILERVRHMGARN